MSDTEVNRVALVTGATRGIGKAIAHELATAGHKVIGTATSDAGAATIAENLRAAGGTGIVYKNIGQVLGDLKKLGL